MGSVKDLIVIEPAMPSKMGTGIFDFSDRYSVFDHGEMPDHIPYMGASRCMMGAHFFEKLMRQGVLTHYRGVKSGDAYTSTSDVNKPSNKMMVYLANVVRPAVRPDGSYDYSAFHNMKGNFVVPVEVIYRNTLPRGSSVFRRLRDGSLSLGGMGLVKEPAEGDALPSPFLDVSTKYEEFDRYPDERKGESAAAFFRDLAGLSDVETDEIREITMASNSMITENLRSTGLRNDDGKKEYLLTPERLIMLGDVFGTLDECRFTYNLDGQWVDMSKEIPRQWYRRKQPDWVAEMDAAKKQYASDWKAHVTIRPEPMPPALVEMLSHVYGSVANAVLERQLFATPSLEEVVAEYQRFRELEMS